MITRVITFKNKTDHLNPIFDNLQIMKFENVFILQRSTFVYICLHDTSPVYFRDYFITCIEGIHQIGTLQAKRGTFCGPLQEIQEWIGDMGIDGPTFVPKVANFYQLRSKEPVKLIKRVKIAHSFLQSVSNQFHVIILKLVYVTLQMAIKEFFETHSSRLWQGSRHKIG